MSSRVSWLLLYLAVVSLYILPSCVVSSELSPISSGESSFELSHNVLLSTSSKHNVETISKKLECPSSCPECPEPECELTVLDQCNCCPVCVRSAGETCGASAGVCSANLMCQQLNDNDEFGKCVDTSSSCLKANCSVVFHPSCPFDSRLVILPPPAGECCGQPGTCHCDQQKCESLVPTCEDGKERVLVEDGRAEPGRCCDIFECREKQSECASVHCPPLPLDENEGVECPADSVRPAEHVPLGGCCPVRPGCRCRASECRPAVCPEGKKLKIVRKGNGNPGRCCDEWKCDDDEKALGKSCERDGKVYSDGQEWMSNACDRCKCKKGVTACSKMTCPKTPVDCTWVMIPEDECCPVCVGCRTDKMEKIRKNETWQKDDCTTCTCSEEGTASCEKYMCTVSCENPRKIEGQCCPVCDEPTVFTLPATCPSLDHCPLRCENGLKRDDRGCFECSCLPDEHPKSIDCPELSKETCDKQCAHGYLKDAAGCGVCRCAKCPPLHQCFKHCLYGFETNSVGCPVCKCRTMSRIEAKLTITDKIGKLTGWDKCISMTRNGKVIERDGGEWWNDGCRHCFCEQKQEFCSLISCPPKPDDCDESNWILKEGSCCSSCSAEGTTTDIVNKHEHTVCQSPGTGRLFTDGETWQLAPCISCTCRVGYVLCHTIECPPIACKSPVLLPNDQCCPRCPTDNSTSLMASKTDTSSVCTDENGAVHKQGSDWRTDDCTSCTCMKDGNVVCFRESCDNISVCSGTPLVIKGRCCPICSDVLSSTDVCTYESSVYSVKEEWKDGDCMKCSCVTGGQTICKETVCPPCVDPVPIDGQCCPLCKDVGPLSLSEGIGGSVNQPSSVISVPFITLTFLSFCIIFGLLILLLILYRRSRLNSKPHMIKDTSVRLSATKHIGSSPHLENWSGKPRHNSHSDDQSESLLSTASETSTAVSSLSSGVGPQPDTIPLTTRTGGPSSKHHAFNV
ncbi:unnamed protein product [Auanema sp. JU1783]|nr:unnamed protein product [Auanema sp. JU1783]